MEEITEKQAEELPFICADAVEDGLGGAGPCGRRFKSQPALNMHRVRKHSGKTWSTTGNFAGTDKSAKRKAYKKQYDLKKKAARLSPPQHSSGVKHCPECGCDLQPYNLAKAAVERFNEAR